MSLDDQINTMEVGKTKLYTSFVGYLLQRLVIKCHTTMIYRKSAEVRVKNVHFLNVCV